MFDNQDTDNGFTQQSPVEAVWHQWGEVQKQTWGMKLLLPGPHPTCNLDMEPFHMVHGTFPPLFNGYSTFYLNGLL